jgi:hypothetical protein
MMEASPCSKVLVIASIALVLALVLVGMNQSFAQFSGDQGQGHDTFFTNRGGQLKTPDSPSAQCLVITSGQSDSVKFTTCP